MPRPKPPIIFPGKSVIAAYFLLRLSMEQSRAEAARDLGARRLAALFQIRAGAFAAVVAALGVEL